MTTRNDDGAPAPTRMQIVIPMSGVGERFRRAGYTVPKPLIEVEGKPIIAHVIDLFANDNVSINNDFTFICNERHLAEPAFELREVLLRHCPTARIVSIAPHKLGPVHAVLQAIDLLDPDAPAIVNYCDFACVWDYARFQRFVADTDCDGAIPCYTGFHPHMLGSTSYAYVRVDGNRILDIQEKQPYTDTPTREHASSGTYYFRSARLLRQCCERTMAQPALSLNGEFYVSLAYKPLLADGGDVALFTIDRFMQWGTPTDLAEYRYWSEIFRTLVNSTRIAPAPRHEGTVMLPMAGLGTRFAREGYRCPKPLLPVSGEPMVVQAARDLPRAPHHVFVQRRDLDGNAQIAAVLRERFPGCAIVDLDAATDGQARTCLLAMAGVDRELPLTIGACDNGALYDAAKLQTLLRDPAIDVIVWTARGYPGAARRPTHYGWVDAQDGRVRAVSVKRPLADPTADPIVIGTFTFRRAGDFVRAAEAMIARDGRVNGEFYVDECINDAIEMGLNVAIFDVDHYLCWGTPDDLRTFEYWQQAFHRWPSHPYRLENDARVAPAALAALRERAETPVAQPRPRTESVS
jgi:NDP-sugar pyrophosphorylase family protein